MASTRPWNLMGKSFVTPAQPLLSWGVITFTRCHDQDVRAFGDQLSVTLGKLGIKSRPRVYAHAHGRQGGHEDLNEDVPELLADGVSIFALKATGVVDGVFNAKDVKREARRLARAESQEETWRSDAFDLLL
ncbi:unnamed protein product [Tilletia caries]|nr:unnamed protein product [Tilletia caries]